MQTALLFSSLQLGQTPAFRENGLSEKRETQIALGCLEIITVQKIIDLLPKNATVNTNAINTH